MTALRHLTVTHIVARFHHVPTEVEYGWIYVNALTLIDLPAMEIHNTVLLDNVDEGAANPWGLAWSADSATLVVTHAGTHEVSVIDMPTVLPHILSLRATLDATNPVEPNAAFEEKPELADDLPFMAGGRQRIKLPKTDLGPRAVVIIGHTAYTANYFSDTLTAIGLGETNRDLGKNTSRHSLDATRFAEVSTGAGKAKSRPGLPDGAGGEISVYSAFSFFSTL